MTARYAFGLIFDRWQLSARDSSGKFKDDHGVYCVFSRDAMAAEMGISLPTLRAAMSQLIKRELIISRIATAGGAWRYYVPRSVIDELRAGRTEQPTRSSRTGDVMLRKTKEERSAYCAAAVVDFDQMEG